jgi:FkbM family methyltransferase
MSLPADLSQSKWHSALDDLLGESIEEVRERERSIASQLALADGDPFILFGAGAWGRHTLAGLRRVGIEPSGFADNDATKWGTSIEGLPVMSAHEAASRFGRDVAFIVTVYTGAKVRRQLRELGLRAFPFSTLALRFPDALMPHNCIDFPHKMVGHGELIRQGLSVWADEASRQEYVAQVRYRLTFDDDVPPCLPPRETYFPTDLVALTDDEVFVDCGAYDGDSIHDFLGRCAGRFGRIVALEPDPQNVARLEASLGELSEGTRRRLEIVPVAAASRRGRLCFNATGTVAASVGEAGATEVACAPMDEILRERIPTYIKMDIEGSESEALAGARAVTAAHAPVLAVCLYHRQHDLWQLPLQIRALNQCYRLFLRRYSDDCWEQICYAIPAERLRTGPASS